MAWIVESDIEKPVILEEEKEEIGGYTIVLKKLEFEGWKYEIYKDDRLVAESDPHLFYFFKEKARDEAVRITKKLEGGK